MLSPEKDFDRLAEESLSLDTRRRLGQHFTGEAVVDLACALALPQGGVHVLDPAAGAGAFLAGAIRREGVLGARFSSMTGVEVDPKALNTARFRLTSPTLSLLEGDFLDPHLPLPHPVQVLLGNPPYLRQETLSLEKKKALREWFMDTSPGVGPVPDRRSDLHVYFWFAAASRLAKGGRIALLTSSAWLDATYGGALQRLLLSRFAVEWVVESAVESWFDAARVRTVVVVARQEDDDGARACQPVRLCRVEAPLDALLPHPHPAHPLARAQAAAAVVQRLSAQDSTHPPLPGWRLRVRPQETLTAGEGPHVGGKWGVPLRLSDGLLEMSRILSSRTRPLADLAGIRFGIKSGADDFFFLKDRGVDLQHSGFRRVQARDGTVLSLPESLLPPLAFSLMEWDRAFIDPSSCRRRMLVIPDSGPLPDSLLAWIRSGETPEKGHSLRPTCRTRTPWYRLPALQRGSVLWPKIQQYRAFAPWNPHLVAASCNFYDLHPAPEISSLALATVLNSTVQVLLARQAGRIRNEGLLKVEVGDARRMGVLDPRALSPEIRAEAEFAFKTLLTRPIQPLPAELEKEDRRRLDRTLLLGLGLPSSRASSLLDDLYSQLAREYQQERSLERVVVQRRQIKSAPPLEPSAPLIR